MKILGIETSCDETALALVEVTENKSPVFDVLKNIIATQIEMHKKYGGIVPGLAKREHAKNLIPVLLKTIDTEKTTRESTIDKNNIDSLLERYPEMLEEFKKKIMSLKAPDIDLIAVTHGPGLEPALWVGVNFARALSLLWDIPIVGIDHMEGHIAVNMLDKNNKITFPAIALAVSGGHTQLILVKDWLNYELLGETLDDAAGEAFDKVARMLGLSFPGGPEIEKIAASGDPQSFDFPRPMERSPDYNFSFSGLKTAVRYKLEKMTDREREENKANVAASFQQSVTDILVLKTIKAAREYNANTVMLAGGVAANAYLRNSLKRELKNALSRTNFIVPEIKLATDNGVMIAIAGYLRYRNGDVSNWKSLKADSNKLITDN